MLVDSHCHLDAAPFDADRGDVLQRALAASVSRQIVPATTADRWPRVRDTCASHPGLHAAYGLHPMFLDNHLPAHLDLLQAWIEAERPVAIGECGLDFHVEGLARDRQSSFFEAQLRLAAEFELPVIVHARKAVDAVISAIRTVGGLSGIVHSFSGSEQQAGQLADQGFLLGIGGPVTYERAQRLRRTVANVPLEWLVLETDAPDQPDSGIRGQRNEPARLAVIAQAVAELRGLAPAEVAAATSANVERIFRLAKAERESSAA